MAWPNAVQLLVTAVTALAVAASTFWWGRQAIDTYKTKAAELKERHESEITRLEKVARDQNSLSQEYIAQLSHVHQERVAGLNERIASLEDRSSQRTLETVNGYKQLYEDTVALAGREKEALEEQLKAVKASARELEYRLEAAQSREGEATGLQEELEQARGKIATLEGRLAAAHREIEELKEHEEDAERGGQALSRVLEPPADPAARRRLLLVWQEHPALQRITPDLGAKLGLDLGHPGESKTVTGPDLPGAVAKRSKRPTLNLPRPIATPSPAIDDWQRRKGPEGPTIPGHRIR